MNQWNTRSVLNNLIMLNAVVFLAQWLMPNMNEILIKYLGLHAVQSAYFYPHQLITYMFLHGNFEHLFFNMFSLWMFGRTLEYDLGGKRFLTYFMITGIGAGVLNLLVNWVEIEVFLRQVGGIVDARSLMNINNMVTVGASGGVYGVLLAFGVMHPNDRIMLLFPPIPMKAKYMVIIFGLAELLFGIASNDNIAHFAHLGGMLFGYILLRYWKSKGNIYY